MTPEEISAVFGRFHEVVAQKLRAGAATREQLRHRLDRGEEPESQRLLWLRATAEKVLQLLITEGQRYNAGSDDRVSAQDMIDVLATATAWLRRPAK